MKSINRNIVIIKPKEPLLDWLKSLPEPPAEFTLEFLRTDCLSFLIPETGSEKEALALLEKHFEKIFEAELMVWRTRDRNWPQNRTFSKFKDWFDMEFHSEVIDLVDVPIMKEGFLP